MTDNLLARKRLEQAKKLVSNFGMHTHGIIFEEPLYGMNVQEIKETLTAALSFLLDPKPQIQTKPNEDIPDHIWNSMNDGTKWEDDYIGAFYGIIKGLTQDETP